MAPKPPGRPSAKMISDLEMLSACDDWTVRGCPFPTDRFLINFPKNLVAAKVAKVRNRGWIDAKLRLTKPGREVYEKLITEAV